MEKNIWNYSCHIGRSLAEINDSQIKLTGKFYSDLQLIAQLINASPHPCFKENNHPETETPYFSAISHRFDLFSFKILCFALSGCLTRMVKFNNCCLGPEHIDLLLPALSQEFVPWLQIDWNPLPDIKIAELLREGSKLQLLALRVSGLGDETFRLLCENLKNNKYLKTLDLYGNNISNLTPFAEVLDINRFLVNLNIGKNHISDDSLNCLIGTFGKLEFPEDKVEEYRKKEKEIAKIKLQKNRGKVVEPEAPADELIQEEETKQFYLLKNKVFKHLNLSFNSITHGETLKSILNHCLGHFKVVISYNPMTPEILEGLKKNYSSLVVL